jgi:hypothetical protein
MKPGPWMNNKIVKTNRPGSRIAELKEDSPVHLPLDVVEAVNNCGANASCMMC